MHGMSGRQRFSPSSGSLHPTLARLNMPPHRHLLCTALAAVFSCGAIAPADNAPLPVQSSLLSSCSGARSIVVDKSERTLELLCGDTIAGRYDVSLGFTPAGHKHHEGDGRTPEGEYLITGKWHSRFHRTLQIGYPNVQDAQRGLAEKQITRRQHDAIERANRSCRLAPQNTPLGSYLQVHGGGGGEESGDWTLGCVALDNDWIEDVFAFHRPGCHADGSPRTPLRIVP